MRAAFACNNSYHLAVARSVACCIDAEWDLYLFGRQPALEQDEVVADPVWRARETWFLEGGLRSQLSLERRSVRRKLESLRSGGYGIVFYFVDKEPSNQLFLLEHSESKKVLIQEGIGLYNGDPMAVAERVKKTAVWAWKFGRRLRCKGAEQGANRYHDDVIARWPDLLPSSKVGQAEVHGYQQVMPLEDWRRSRPVGGESGPLGESRPCVLFVGSGVEVTSHSWLSLDREREILCRLVDAAEAAGMAFLVKPHPREAKGKYEKIDSRIQVIDSLEPVEGVCLTVRPEVVVTFMSSAVLNLLPLFRVVLLYDLIGSDFANKRVLKQIRPQVEGVEVPGDISEAVAAIGGVAKKDGSEVDEFAAKPLQCIRDVAARIVSNA